MDKEYRRQEAGDFDIYDLGLTIVDFSAATVCSAVNETQSQCRPAAGNPKHEALNSKKEATMQNKANPSQGPPDRSPPKRGRTKSNGGNER